MGIFRLYGGSSYCLGAILGATGICCQLQGFYAASLFHGLRGNAFSSLLSLLIGFTVIAQSLPQLQGVGANALIGHQ